MGKQRQFNFCGDCSTCFTFHRCGGYSGKFVLDPELAQKRLCLYSDQLIDAVNDVNGLDFPALVTKPLPPVPPFIPQLTNPFFRGEQPFDYPVVAVSVNRVFCGSSSINSNLLSAGTVQRWLNLSPHTHVMLVGCAKDRPLENVWEHSRVSDLFPSLHRLGFSSMTALNFSIYLREPRMEHLVNLKRSAVTAVEAADAGMAAIPHIHWGRDIDLERMADWLCEQSSVNAVAFCMQTYRTERLWRRALEGILYFNSLMNRPLTYILIGVSSLSRVTALSSLPKLCLISARPFMMAEHYQTFAAQGAIERLPRMSRAQLFYHNLRTVLGVPDSQIPSA